MSGRACHMSAAQHCTPAPIVCGLPAPTRGCRYDELAFVDADMMFVKSPDSLFDALTPTRSRPRQARGRGEQQLWRAVTEVASAALPARSALRLRRPAVAPARVHA